MRLRTNNFLVGDAVKNSGSFTTSFGLASLLTPAGVFALVVAYMTPRLRPLAGIVFLLCMVGLITSYIRTALVAVVVGSLALAVLMASDARVSARRRAYAAGLIVLVLAGGYGATLVAGTADKKAEDRAASLLNPLSDESVQTRFDTWQVSLDKLVDQPLGTGLGSVGRATVTEEELNRRPDPNDKDLSGEGTYTDNSYLLVLQEQGFLGGALFILGVVGTAVLCARRLSRVNPLERPLGVAALVAVASFLVLFLTGDYIEQPGKAFWWTLLGVAAWDSYRP